MLNFKDYFAPTPKKFRMLGDIMMVVSAGITGSGMYFNNQVMQLAVFAGIIGKIITNFATEKTI